MVWVPSIYTRPLHTEQQPSEEKPISELPRFLARSHSNFMHYKFVCDPLMNYLWWRGAKTCACFKVWVWESQYLNHNWVWFYYGFFLLVLSLGMSDNLPGKPGPRVWKIVERLDGVLFFQRECYLASGSQLVEITLIQSGSKLIWVWVFKALTIWGLPLPLRCRKSQMKPWNVCLDTSTLAASELFYFFLNLPRTVRLPVGLFSVSAS